MKRIIVLLLSAFCVQQSVFAQGNLTPPGAPAPTMKTLAQIEPRTAITNSGFVTISNSGSYYLTTNIIVATGDGIAVTTNGVTLDLNGFTIRTTSSNYSGFGIRLSGSPRNITILNGFIVGTTVWTSGTNYSGGGFIFAIAHDVNSPINTRVNGVSVTGCLEGIRFDESIPGTIIESCTLESIKGRGIVAATISKCSAFHCGSDAITGVTVTDCYGSATGNGDGIHGDTVNNCKGVSIGSDGIYANVANNCEGLSVTGNGMSVGKAAENCRGSGGVGIRAEIGTTLAACVGENSQTGIFTLAGSAITDCTAKHNVIGINAGNGIIIKDCATYSNTNMGISVLDGSVVGHCSAYLNGSTGISAGEGSVIDGCTAYDNGGSGIRVSDNARVIGNNSYKNTDHGILAGSFNHIEGNTITLNVNSGIRCTGGNNIILRNMTSGNKIPTVNFELAAGNRVAPIVSPPITGAITGNSGGAGLGTTDPNANFSY